MLLQYIMGHANIVMTLTVTHTLHSDPHRQKNGAAGSGKSETTIAAAKTAAENTEKTKAAA